ncbi:MAG: hypothetical protein FJX76_12915 [Armatimonadetes bacterium]|nr:hypothetical protein [Armatimonadota bacterium]
MGQEAADSITEAVQRARSLAVRAADDSLSDGDRGALQKELQGLTREINQTASRATYNGKSLLDGTADITVQSGANEGEVSNIKIDKLTADSLFEKPVGELSIATREDAFKFISMADKALDKVGAANLNMGAYNNTLERTLDLQRQNLTSTAGARANLGDADIAREAANRAVSEIINQANLAMVAQGNANASTVLRLFG